MISRAFIFCAFLSLHLVAASDFDFTPAEFVSKAQSGGVEHGIILDGALSATLGVTLPDTLEGGGADTLLKDATKLSAQADALLAQITALVSHFSDSSGPEAQNLQSMYTNVLQLQRSMSNVASNVYSLNTTVYRNEKSLSDLNSVLSCLKASDCRDEVLKTTPFTPPAYDCSGSNLTVSTVGDTGSWSFLVPTKFSCPLEIVSFSYGLWIDVTVSPLTGSGSMTIEDSRAGTTVKINATGGTFKDLTGQFITFTITNDLAFNISFVAMDPCKETDCGHGTCSINPANNQPICTCDGCYDNDPTTGACTVAKPDPCGAGSSGEYYCQDQNACHVNTGNCTYYCVCPVNPPTCTAPYCSPTSTTCNMAIPADFFNNKKDGSLYEKIKSFWS